MLKSALFMYRRGAFACSTCAKQAQVKAAGRSCGPAVKSKKRGRLLLIWRQVKQ